MGTPYPKASLIIPIYKDLEALKCIIFSLQNQSISDFELIITEDDNSQQIAEYLNEVRNSLPSLRHLQQDDEGFRKTVAVNRAIAVAKGDYLIFTDGDCIPHPRFIEQHLNNAEHGKVCVGRRIDLGTRFSKLLKNHPSFFKVITNRFYYLLLALPLHLDGVRSYEVGFPSKILHRLSQRRNQGVLGCNFSCYKNDLIKINGYDEDFSGSGGEDDDLSWRLLEAGIMRKIIKFLAPVYHLRASNRRGSTEQNRTLLQKKQSGNNFFCTNGLDKYL